MNNTTDPSVPDAEDFRRSDVFKILFVNTLLLVGVIVNVKVLYVVFTLPPRKRRRPSSVLVVHLGMVAICFAIFCSILVADTQKLVILTGHGICEALSVLKRVFVGAFAMNVFAIVFEQFQKFNCFNGGKLRLRRLIFFIWTVAIALALPSVFTVKYKKNRAATLNSTNKKCEPTLLAGSLAATIFLEFIHLIVFHCLIVCYMIYAMYKIKASLAQLYLLKPIPNRTTRRKVRRIRFVYLHFISFILLWLPSGVLTFVERVIKSADISHTFRVISTMRNCVGIIVYVYMLLNPLIYLWLMPSKKSTKPNNASTLAMRRLGKELHPAKLKRRKGKATKAIKDAPERSSTEFSRMSTCVLSPAASEANQNGTPRIITTTV